ncbi:HAD family hydrolase [Sphingomonas koreensis]|nr:HAD family hydrolase [Sphingomonas koreensis]
MPLKAIIFDVDGTLAETEETHRRAFNQAFAEAGEPWRWSADDYRALLTTTGGRERIQRYLDEAGISAHPETVRALHARKNALYAAFVAQSAVTPRPGVMRLIEQARARGVMLAIATTTSRANLAALMRYAFGTESAGWFAAMAVGEDVAVKKPDPEVYRRVLSSLALDAAECVAIEDSRNGLDAARACGIATLVTPSFYTQAEAFDGAALVCPDLAAIDLTMLEAMVADHTPTIEALPTIGHPRA